MNFNLGTKGKPEAHERPECSKEALVRILLVLTRGKVESEGNQP